jgi:DNA-binding CsgD family transcriptional regulator
MIGQDHSYAEPEAIRLLRAIVDDYPEAQCGPAPAAIRNARQFLRAITQPRDRAPTGRALSRVTPEQLREIAHRALRESQTQIARSLGLKHHTVWHHLTPSKAMLAACAEAPEGRAP